MKSDKRSHGGESPSWSGSRTSCFPGRWLADSRPWERGHRLSAGAVGKLTTLSPWRHDMDTCRGHGVAHTRVERETGGGNWGVRCEELKINKINKCRYLQGITRLVKMRINQEVGWFLVSCVRIPWNTGKNVFDECINRSATSLTCQLGTSSSYSIQYIIAFGIVLIVEDVINDFLSVFVCASEKDCFLPLRASARQHLQLTRHKTWPSLGDTWPSLAYFVSRRMPTAGHPSQGSRSRLLLGDRLAGAEQRVWDLVGGHGDTFTENKFLSCHTVSALPFTPVTFHAELNMSGSFNSNLILWRKLYNNTGFNEA